MEDGATLGLALPQEVQLALIQALATAAKVEAGAAVMLVAVIKRTLFAIVLTVMGLSAQADGNTRAPIVSAATSIQGCNEGLIMYQGQYKCRSVLYVSQGGLMADRYVSEGGLIPDPVVVAARDITGCIGPYGFGREKHLYVCYFSDGPPENFIGPVGFSPPGLVILHVMSGSD